MVQKRSHRGCEPAQSRRNHGAITAQSRTACNWEEKIILDLRRRRLAQFWRSIDLLIFIS
jgi:hypothetical protein